MISALDAYHLAALEYPGGIPALATRIGVSPHVLHNKLRGAERNRLALSEAQMLDAILERPAGLHAQAATLGYLIVPVEGGPTGTADMALLEAMSKVWASNGELGQAVHAALADGRIEAHEVQQIRREVHRTIRAMHGLLCRLESLQEPEA